MKPEKNKHAQALTTRRNKILTPERRREIAINAANARWGTRKKKWKGERYD